VTGRTVAGPRRRAIRAAWQPAVTAAVLAAGLLARWWAPGAGYDSAIWYAGLAATGTLVVRNTLRGAVRGQFAADVVATLAIVTAVLLGQPFVGLVIVLMQTGGEALERIGMATVGVFDKTGTITIGLPRVSRVITAEGCTENGVLRLAGAIERTSGHLLARTLVDAAEAAGVSIPAARDVVEVPGRGVAGTVEGHRVVVGARSFVVEETSHGDAKVAVLEPADAGLRAYVAVDDTVAGIVEYADALRPELSDVLCDLTALGVGRIILLSGDYAENARTIAEAAGIGEVHGDLLPEEKVAVVRELVSEGEAVLMVGDGTNDAPALSAATVGVALAGHGGGITAEAADVVILIDDLSRVVDAMRISRRTMDIARQCIVAGLGLSAVAMVAAAMGRLTPTAGALVQEGIDLAVIVNTLRASR
jgi:P-type E1-E2 ATPase